jgi:hypothetical protein
MGPAEEGVEVYQDLCRQLRSTGGMVDVVASIIRENEGIGPKRFPTAGTPFRETLNPRPEALFVVKDEHDIPPL